MEGKVKANGRALLPIIVFLVIFLALDLSAVILTVCRQLLGF